MDCMANPELCGPSGDYEEEEDNDPQFTLSCNESVTRGKSAGCTVIVSGSTEQGRPYTESDFQYDWISDHTSKTGTGSDGNTWRGTATETVTIRVQVASEGYSDSRTIQVTPRTLGALPTLNAEVQYSGEPGKTKNGRVGLYRIPSDPLGTASRLAGSGPWANHYMTKVTINGSFPSELHISHDFDPYGGPGYSGAADSARADSTNCSNYANVPSSASYKEINTVCGDLSA